MEDDLEDDVLVSSADFNLLGLIEDEVLMALPLVPRHDSCPAGVVQVLRRTISRTWARKTQPLCRAGGAQGPKTIAKDRCVVPCSWRMRGFAGYN